VTPVLKWVRQEDEQIIREVFTKTLLVRQKGKDARELADMYFFETLVRIHRAGEGEPYTGLKPADSPLAPGIEAADEALESSDVKQLMLKLHKTLESGIHTRFGKATEYRKREDQDVESGRVFVAAYVDFIRTAGRSRRALLS
jgi:hypothetical protein